MPSSRAARSVRCPRRSFGTACAALADDPGAVQRDFNEALDHYEGAGGLYLADRLEADLWRCIAAIKAGPTSFPFYRKSDRFRRVRLKSFPYVIVYRENAATIRVTILMHERRRPSFGIARR